MFDCWVLLFFDEQSLQCFHAWLTDTSIFFIFKHGIILKNLFCYVIKCIYLFYRNDISIDNIYQNMLTTSVYVNNRKVFGITSLQFQSRMWNRAAIDSRPAADLRSRYFIAVSSRSIFRASIMDAYIVGENLGKNDKYMKRYANLSKRKTDPLSSSLSSSSQFSHLSNESRKDQVSLMAFPLKLHHQQRHDKAWFSLLARHFARNEWENQLIRGFSLAALGGRDGNMREKNLVIASCAIYTYIQRCFVSGRSPRDTRITHCWKRGKYTRDADVNVKKTLFLPEPLFNGVSPIPLRRLQTQMVPHRNEIGLISL